ncbi:MAG: terminase [Dehalococcoidia bacterium]|nr:MAG: terminase [Dehalococcoidia bacterium]
MTTLTAPKGTHIGPEAIPKHTLGWQILGWTREYLLQPDGPKAGEPWVFTDEQARFVLNWYAIDQGGRFVYRYGMYRRMKGHGKDPLGAALCCIEFVGPCRFDRWEDGEPVAKPHMAAWIQTAAVSREQTRNTMTLFPGMISPRAREEHRIDLGKEIIYADDGRRRIEAVTSSPRAVEGGRATFILKNETHHWISSNEGHEMSKVIARNAAKSRDGSSRVLAISNAHAPGEDSDAERDWDTHRKISQGLSSAPGLLNDSLEAPEDTDRADDESLRVGLLGARGDSEWIDIDRLIAEIRDPRTTPAMARRFYLDQIVAEEDKPFDRKRFEGLKRHGYKVKDGALITLGFDGSMRRDHTALIGTEVGTGYQWVVGYWEPDVTDRGDEPWIAVDEVDETVDDAFARWQVWRMYADPYYWSGHVSAWAGKYGADRVISWATNQYRKMGFALLSYRNAIQESALSHDGDRRLIGAVGNAHKHMQSFRDDQDNFMWTIQKERPDSPLKIDAAMAAVLSWEARTHAIAEGATGVSEAGVFFV